MTDGDAVVAGMSLFFVVVALVTSAGLALSARPTALKATVAGTYLVTASMS